MSKYYVEYGALQANGKRLIECETSALDAKKITEDFAREIADALNCRGELADVEAKQVSTQGKTSAVGNEAEMCEALPERNCDVGTAEEGGEG